MTVVGAPAFVTSPVVSAVPIAGKAAMVSTKAAAKTLTSFFMNLSLKEKFVVKHRV